jgi:alpha(1,3/1,4) fucosyltransferase
MGADRNVKTILFDIYGLWNGALFDPARRDNSMEPFIHLRNRLRERGYDLRTADDHQVESADRIILFDVPLPATPWWKPWRRRPYERDLVAECSDRRIEDRLVLLLMEPPVVYRENWERSRHEKFPVVFTWNDDWIDGTKYLKVHEPVPATFPDVPDIPFDQRKLAVMITSNKLSSHAGELYSARRECIRRLGALAPDDFELFGPGWRRHPPRGYRGLATNKWEVHPRFRFGICYENMGGVRGLVSERIFDCMRAGCVPVYLGATNIEEYVDTGCFIDRRRFCSEDELVRYLKDVTEADFRQFRQAIDAYLASERFSQFLPEAYFQTLLSGLRLEP